jgi:glycosyltransferase involved in cell wall biosynthesis
MRVALVSETYPPEINGVALTVANMADGLHALGHQVVIVRPRQAKGRLAHDDEHEHLTTPGVRIPGYQGLRVGLPCLVRLCRAWLRQRPDVVYVATEGPLGWAALRVAKRLSIPVCSGFHTRFDEFAGHYGLGLAAPLASRYLRRFHNHTASTLVPTLELQAWLANQGYQRVDILQRSVDLSRFHPSHRCEALRQKWGVDEQTPVVIYVGRTAAEKDLDLTVEAFERFRQHQPQARMVWVGDGPKRPCLQSAHPDHIFTGALSGAELSRAWASADVFVFTSCTETFGNVTLEALASGLAIVAYNYAAAALTIRHGDNGLLAAKGDAPALLAQCQRLAGDDRLRSQLRRQARCSVAHLSQQHVSERLALLMTSLIEETPA